jgi:hypothetical protein
MRLTVVMAGPDQRIGHAGVCLLYIREGGSGRVVVTAPILMPPPQQFCVQLLH